MRALLFVQSGRGRPVSRGVVRTEPNPIARVGSVVHYTMTPGQLQARADADYWWVVLCHSASDGRALVYQHGISPPNGATWAREWMAARARISATGAILDFGWRR